MTELAGTLVVLSPGDTRFEQHAQHPASWVARVGGASRAETVRAGLDALKPWAPSLTTGCWCMTPPAA